MGISRQERPEMFRRLIFDRVPEVQASEVVRDDLPAAAPPIERPRTALQRRTVSILHRVVTTTPRGTE